MSQTDRGAHEQHANEYEMDDERISKNKDGTWKQIWNNRNK
jgi:hypothetical protein